MSSLRENDILLITLHITLVAVLIMLTLPLRAQTFSVIHNFSYSGGFWPFSGVTRDTAGNLWGTTSSSIQGAGAVYELKSFHGSWLYIPLFYFDTTDGFSPWSRVVFGPGGALYGTTLTGGMGCYPNNGCGLVYSLRPPSTFCAALSCVWTETIMYEFTGGQDGADPIYGSVVFDNDGNLYDTASAGGTAGRGVVFELVRSNGGWTEQVLYNFQGGSDGWQPVGGMVFDSAGNLYGTTIAGGTLDCGTIFELSPNGSGWTHKVLYSFLCGSDGNGPIATPILDQYGNLYGSTFYGGAGNGGVVWELSPESNGKWSFNALYELAQGP